MKTTIDVLAQAPELAEKAVVNARGLVPAKDADLVLRRGLGDTAALRAAREFQQAKASEWAFLVLSGPPGVGKTTALGWLGLQTAAVLGPKPGPRNLSDYHCSDGPRTIYFRESVAWARATELARVGLYDREAIKPYLQRPILILDDLGLEFRDAKGAFDALIGEVLDHRYAERRRTAISTNLTAREFTERYGERIVDRLRECGRFVTCTGPSMRGVAR